MGQQQLLLLVLGVVIVGFAVVVGINAFSTQQVKANSDALASTAFRFANDIQTWAAKPDIYGGLNGWSNIDGGSFDFADIGLPAGDTYTDEDGTYTVSGSSGTVIITAESKNQEGNTVVVTVDGPSADDISAEMTYGS